MNKIKLCSDDVLAKAVRITDGYGWGMGDTWLDDNGDGKGWGWGDENGDGRGFIYGYGHGGGYWDGWGW